MFATCFFDLKVDPSQCQTGGRCRSSCDTFWLGITLSTSHLQRICFTILAKALSYSVWYSLCMLQPLYAPASVCSSLCMLQPRCATASVCYSLRCTDSSIPPKFQNDITIGHQIYDNGIGLVTGLRWMTYQRLSFSLDAENAADFSLPSPLFSRKVFVYIMYGF